MTKVEYWYFCNFLLPKRSKRRETKIKNDFSASSAPSIFSALKKSFTQLQTPGSAALPSAATMSDWVMMPTSRSPSPMMGMW